MSLAEEIREARVRTLEVVSDLNDEQLIGPRLLILNPLRWEIAHVAWFWETWILRRHRGGAPLREGVDALYDSMAVPHETRWDLPLLSREETLRYMQEVLEEVVGRLSDDETYLCNMCLAHEDMHVEAFTYTRQTLGYPRPPFSGRVKPGASTELISGDAAVPGGMYQLGARQDGSFVHDNEKWAHPVEVSPFHIARTQTTCGEFRDFVDAGGYRTRAFWSEDGWRWRREARADHPVYWRRDGGWQHRRWDRWEPLPDRAAMIHVTWFEAEAYCRWAGRRLPTEAEWELAASGFEKRRFPWGDDTPTRERANLDWNGFGTIEVDALPAGDSPFGCRQMIGNVWEWTSTRFEPYPGFTPDPYKEYSQPWFGEPFVLRGGAWTTRSRMIRNTWRNFYTPDRRDALCGFRTCADA